ncbi:S41 family peptidase [Kitasatospora sp. NBC_01287]|uniref:S41 family peptidase n=1 Tax=Kitasatospora sp. NBC_01287 TaxID=2903573 RepID=UPI0022590A33|nr:S41 family peptidase [Kitasatospora sp. NBC_01287]MCX4745021.1 S41 family peptidase [Kitasatospora sp. NBC_01287]
MLTVLSAARGRRSARRIRAYLLDALELIRRTALYSDTVDWTGVRQEAQAVLTGAGGYADTHTLLREVLLRAGGRHSGLRLPRAAVPPEVRERLAARAAALGPPLPTGRVVEGVGYLRLPGLSDGYRLARDYARAGDEVLGTLLAAAPRAWVVDVRANTGGNMWPMLAVAAPLLRDGVLGRFEGPDGQSEAWTLEDGRVSLGGKPTARSRSPLGSGRRAADAPLALLTSGHTASAGEAVVVAFQGQSNVRTIGAPTAGYTTGNRTHQLRDGARLVISGSFYADREGNRFDGPLPVDERIARGEPDAVPAAARAWLSGPGRAGGGDGRG